MRGPHCRRRSSPLLLAAVALWAGLAAAAAAQGNAASDRAALEALYDATDGPSWNDSTNWKSAAPLDEWYGVTADASDRVTELRLGENGLIGSIPTALGRLGALKWLDLSSNELRGSIPSALSSLGNLFFLNLSRNDLDGAVPAWLGDMSSLLALYVSSNELTGGIPQELGNLNLYGLGFSWNDLTVGPIPTWLRNHTNLRWLYLSGSDVTGGIPVWLGNLVNLQSVYFSRNHLAGPIPSALGRLENLEDLDLSYNWGVSGSVPSGLRQARLEELDILVTQACAPGAWQDWLATIDFTGRLCGAGTDVEIDVAVVYTSGARDAAGGVAAIEAEIDLMVAETNQAYAASGVHHRVALVDRSELSYTETGDARRDLDRLLDPSDGHLDEVHTLRDEVGADLVHLIVGEADDICGRARILGVFGLTLQGCGGRTFAHELGHNMGLRHDRYAQLNSDSESGRGPVTPDPSFGYVNQRAFASGALPSSRWRSIMAYNTQCDDAGFFCSKLLRFSNPRQRYNGDPLGVPFGSGGSGVTGPADAAAVLNATGPAVALWRDPPARANRPPAASGTLPDRALTLPGTLDVAVSAAFVDPDGDALTYAVSSSAPSVVTVSAAGARVTLTAVSAGTATIRVTAMDPGGLSAAQAFTVSVSTGAAAGFTDDPLRPGVTPVRAVHFTELRARIDALREAAGLGRFRWTDPALRAGATPVRLVHLTELRSALAAAYTAAGRSVPRWTDAAPTAGTTPIRAVHLTELRAAVVALE